MEKRKYNSSLDNMQIFALKSAELNKIKGGNLFDNLVVWVQSLFDVTTTVIDDGNTGHGGGPK